MDQLLRTAWMSAIVCTIVLIIGVTVVEAKTSVYATRAYTVRGDVAIAGFKTNRFLSDAPRVFGKPDMLQRVSNRLRDCRTTWSDIGLTLTFRGNGCRGNSWFLRARITGRNWRTLRGLRVGQPLAELTRKYPDARRESGEFWILLSRGSVHTLSAHVDRGLVEYLLVSAYQTTIRW